MARQSAATGSNPNPRHLITCSSTELWFWLYLLFAHLIQQQTESQAGQNHWHAASLTGSINHNQTLASWLLERLEESAMCAYCRKCTLKCYLLNTFTVSGYTSQKWGNILGKWSLPQKAQTLQPWNEILQVCDLNKATLKNTRERSEMLLQLQLLEAELLSCKQIVAYFLFCALAHNGLKMNTRLFISIFKGLRYFKPMTWEIPQVSVGTVVSRVLTTWLCYQEKKKNAGLNIMLAPCPTS